MTLATFRTLVFTTNSLLSAFLLFLAQPMLGRLILPSFGGGAAVWNTCLIFFQIALLAGYAWARFGASHLSPRVHQVAHLLLVVIAAAFLPMTWWQSPVDAWDSWPLLQLLLSLSLISGPILILLASNGPLTQRWFHESTGRDPYFLSAFSNVGSLCGLIAYPLALEPITGLLTQRSLFGALFIAFVVLSTVAVALSSKTPKGSAAKGIAGTQSWKTRLRWMALAMVPSLLLYAVSMRITTDVAPVPLLWIAPLSVYLVTFIIAFIPSMPFPRWILEQVGMALLMLCFLSIDSQRYEAVLGVSLATLFVVGWVCHGDLRVECPPGRDAADFFLWVALGGALGGAFSTLVAPVAFNSLAEFPIAIAFGAWALVRFQGFRKLSIAAAVGCALSLALAVILFNSGPAVKGVMGLSMIIGAVLYERAVFAGACIVIAGWLVILGTPSNGVIRYAERDFYGTLRVEDTRTADGTIRRILWSGSTLHGMQEMAPVEGRPLSYYHSATPLASIVRSMSETSRIGVVGMGAGALAAFGKRGQEIVWFELNPEMEGMARAWFTFLPESQARIDTVVGDARMKLQRTSNASFDLLVIDAFSSDSVPVHLLTVEAFDLYMQKLSPDGVLALHLSNRHLALERVVLGAVEERDLAALSHVRRLLPEEAEDGALPSEVVAVARSAAVLDRLGPGWKSLSGKGLAWTDDRASLLPLLRRRAVLSGPAQAVGLVEPPPAPP